MTYPISCGSVRVGDRENIQVYPMNKYEKYTQFPRIEFPHIKYTRLIDIEMSESEFLFKFYPEHN